MKAELQRLRGADERANRLGSDDYTRFWQWIGKVREQADIADALAARLEAVWHLWNNSGGDKLIYPLSSSIIPDEIKSWQHKQLLEFRILYRSHVEEVRGLDKQFHSRVIDDGFPCDGQDYLFVRHKITSHAEALRAWADASVEEFDQRLFD